MRRQICFGLLLTMLLVMCLALTGCGPKNYTVVFDANGGQGSMEAQTYEAGQTQALAQNTFTKANCDFVGWALNKDAATADYTDGQSVKDLVKEDGTSVTLYAVWAPHTYTVSFDANGGTGTMGSQKFQVGNAQALSANAFQNANGSFVGWALEKDATQAAYTDGQSVTDLAGKGETVTLYAVWSGYTYTVVFDGNGATNGSMLQQNMVLGQEAKLTANAFTKGWQYEFLGWATDKNAEAPTYTDGQNVADLAGAGETVTLYAVWGPWQVPDVEPEAADDLVLEDVNDKGISDLTGSWAVKVYDNTWKDTTASLVIAAGYDKSNAMKFSYWDNGNAYRYSVDYSTNGDFDTLCIDVKGNGISNVTVQLAEKNGVYMSYSLGVVPAVWTRYEISIFDEAWTVNYSGQSVSVPEAIKALGMKSYYDVYQWFTTMHIIFKGNTDNGANGYSFMDNICFKQTKAEAGSVSTILYDFGTNYTTALADGTVVQILLSADKATATVKTLNLKQNIVLEGVACDQLGSGLVFTGTGFTAEAALVGNGEKIKITSVTGDAAALLQDAEFGQVYTVDDFEGYTSTGKGVDSSMPDIWSTSGLRGGYYTEVYTGKDEHTTTVGGKKWNWQDSSVNYIDLSTDAHSGSKSMQLAGLQNDNARYISMSTVKGGAASIGKGTTLSLWVKNPSNVALKIEALKACYRDTVSNANIQSTNFYSASKSVELPANSGWTQVEVELDPTKDVYGFILVIKSNYTAVKHLLVDDVMVYSANPFATYVDPSTKPQMPEYANVNLDYQQYTHGDYQESDWKQQSASSSGWNNTSGQMRIRVSSGTNMVLNMYTTANQAYRYTYVGNGAGLGKANYFSIDLGNYFTPNKDIKFKIALVDTDGKLHYLCGDANSYEILGNTKEGNEQKLKSFEWSFDEITVQSFFIEIMGTDSGSQYVYMDNVVLKKQ